MKIVGADFVMIHFPHEILLVVQRILFFLFMTHFLTDTDLSVVLQYLPLLNLQSNYVQIKNYNLQPPLKKTMSFLISKI